MKVQIEKEYGDGRREGGCRNQSVWASGWRHDGKKGFEMALLCIIVATHYGDSEFDTQYLTTCRPPQLLLLPTLFFS